MADQSGFFDLDKRYAALSAAGDPLERLAVVVLRGVPGRAGRGTGALRPGKGRSAAL